VPHRWRGTAIAISPAAPSARAGTKCPDKSFAVKPASGGKTIDATAKAIRAGWRRLHRSLQSDPRLAGRQGRERLGDPSRRHRRPKGFIAEMAEKPGKTIKFAVPAG
jgi:hypothetical protein